MSDKKSASGKSCSTASCCAWKFAAALVLLRLCVGWHFFSEGTKKISFDQGRQEWNLDFSAEGFFRGATGPLAGTLKSQLPGFYDWQNLLATPKQSKPLTVDQAYQQRDWINGYNARRKQVEEENKKKKKAGEATVPLPIEFPEFAAYKPWAEKIVAGFRGKLQKFTDLPGISDAQASSAAELFLARHQQLADLLSSESDSITEYQHELWRLGKLEAQGGAGDIPFRMDRVMTKRSETKGMGSRLVSEARVIDRGLNNDLRSLLTPEQQQSTLQADLDSILTDPKTRKLELLNRGVTCLIIGIGVCLLLGLFTRLAAVGGILFLLSVMATQLPWVAGADTKFFYYQLVECAALLALLASGPWRLPSLDGLLRGVFHKDKSSAAKR